MTGPDRASSEIASRRDPNAEFLRDAHRRERLVQERDARRLRVSETTAVGRREAGEAVEPREPGPGRDDRRGVDLSAMGVADAQIEAAGCADIARRQDAHPSEVAGRLSASREEVGLRITESGYPVRAAKPGEVRVAVN